MDNNRKDVRDSLDTLRDDIRKPITEFEEAEKAKVAAAQAILDRLTDLSAPMNIDGSRLTVEQLQLRQKDVADMQGQDYGEFAAQIQAKITATLQQIENMLQSATEYEAQQAEIARLHAEQAAREQAEHEAKIAAAAAERAKAEAEAKAKAETEAAERARIEAQIRAERAEAEAKAVAERAEAEKQAAIEAERQRIAAEQAAKEQAEAAKAADIEHQRTINRAVISALIEAGIDDDIAKSLLIKIVRGEIPHVKICY